MKRIVSLLLIIVSLISVLAIGASAASEFPDVNGHWGQPAIDYWVDKGAVNGYGDGTFRPDNRITRAEVAQILKNTFGLKGAGAGFTDVSAMDWYHKAVLAAQEVGAFEGYADGSFKPNDYISREECIVMLRRITDTEENFELGKHFADYDDVCDWAKGSVGALNKVGVLDGYNIDGVFYVYVHRNITRAEFEKLLYIIDTSDEVNWNIPGYTDKEEEKTPEKPVTGGGGSNPITYYICTVQLQEKGNTDPSKVVRQVVADNFILGSSPVLADVATFLTADVTTDDGTGVFENIFHDADANVILKQMMLAYNNAATDPTTWNNFVDAVTVTKNGVADTTLQAAVKANVDVPYERVGVGTWDIEYTVQGSGRTYVVTLEIKTK